MKAMTLYRTTNATRMAMLILLLLSGLAALQPVAVLADEKPFTILNTNDWQSRLLGFGPNTEYTPESINDDLTIGGVARLATLIDELKLEHKEQPLLLLDGGDVSQGTLFHTLYQQQAFELRLMKQLGYDAITLGNHEFDFGTNGLSRMLTAAQEHLSSIPPIIASNLMLAPAQKKWQENGVIQPWKIIEKGGIRFGLFGLMGKNADEVTPAAKPSTFKDQVETAKAMVKLLREEQQADVVILLSHSGVEKNSNGTWGGEEVEYAKQVSGIDIIVGGHSHTALHKPIQINDTIIIQAGSEIQYLGELNMALDNNNNVKFDNYTLHPINDTILGDQSIINLTKHFQQLVNEHALSKLGYDFDQKLVKTSQTLKRSEGQHTLGNLISDGIRQAANSDIAMTANGVIRDDLYHGKNGYQSVSDIFRLQPLGVGADGEPGYPLIKLWLTGKEVRELMEVLTFVSLKGASYSPQLSGVRLTYNALRPPLDRITALAIGDSKNGYQPVDPDKLYSFATSSYVGDFLWLIDEMSFGLIAITPKNEKGAPLAGLEMAIIDRDPNTPGVQEYKNWQAQLNFFAGLPDADRDGIANITLDGATTAPRMQRISSLWPNDLLRNATWIVWTGIVVLLTLLGCLGACLFRALKKPMYYVYKIHD